MSRARSRRRMPRDQHTAEERPEARKPQQATAREPRDRAQGFSNERVMPSARRGRSDRMPRMASGPKADTAGREAASASVPRTRPSPASPQARGRRGGGRTRVPVADLHRTRRWPPRPAAARMRPPRAGVAATIPPRPAEARCRTPGRARAAHAAGGESPRRATRRRPAPSAGRSRSIRRRARLGVSATVLARAGRTRPRPAFMSASAAHSRRQRKVALLERGHDTPRS